MKTDLSLNIEKYNYDLPLNRIAQFPLKKQDHSKLLICKENQIDQDLFYNIKKYIPEKSLLVFNDTKVIHARLLFKKDTGAVIEIFCLEPSGIDIQTAFQQKKNCEWKCLIGNNKRWKSGLLEIENEKANLFAERVGQDGEYFIIKFLWEPENLTFSEILEIFGKVPLPPYINRDAEESDNTRYQTVYAKNEGSVAAPTAGLHFTDNILSELSERGIKKQFLTLHVGAGTFKPVTAQNIADHEMHEEHFSIGRGLLKSVLYQVQDNNPVLPVGTTSLRTLESLYWLGVKRILKHKNLTFLDQWEWYNLKEKNISVESSLSALLEYMHTTNTLQFDGTTQMMIVPGYDFKIANGIITNFHQPRSTLLLLIAAMIGKTWEEAYKYAIENDFRFLSYGDCCLFLV